MESCLEILPFVPPQPAVAELPGSGISLFMVIELSLESFNSTPMFSPVPVCTV